MTIRFQCPNLVRFDPATQQYVRCGHTISVEDSLAADTVECPECGNDVEVPVGVTQEPASTASQSSASTSASRRVKTAVSSAPLVKSSPTQQAPNQPSSLATSSTQTSDDVPIADVPLETESKMLQYAAFDANHACLKCGGQVQESMKNCPHCGAARRIITDQKPLEAIEVQPAGMQLWWNKQMTSSSGRGFFAKGMGFIVVWLATGVCVSSFLLFKIFSIPIALPTIGLTVAYFMAFRRLKAMQKKPGLPLYPWQRLIWNFLIPVFRTMDWNFSAFTTPKVLTVRQADFSGMDLHVHEGMRSHTVIDMSGCQITDQELLTLHHSPHIQAFVLTNTAVTHEGVFRLQQAIPKAWIWY